MENIHGKEISLQYVTVKVPGQKPRGSRSVPAANGNASQGGDSNLTNMTKGDKKGEKVMLTGFELLRETSAGEENELNTANTAEKTTAETPNVKKRHRRIKSNGVKSNQDCEDPDVFEFHIVSLDNKQWFFEAASAEERDDWVTAIEQQILNSLQGNESNKAKGQVSSAVDVQAMRVVKNDIPGNNRCVDCDAPSKKLFVFCLLSSPIIFQSLVFFSSLQILTGPA